jgi:hypothetical protein
LLGVATGIGGALKARQRVPKACVEPLADQDPHQRASPSLQKGKIAMILDAATVAGEWRTAAILMNSDAKRQMYIQAKAMLVRIDLDHPKRQLQMK